MELLNYLFNMQIDTQALSQWLHSHKGKDINQLLTKAVTQSYVEAFPKQTVSKHIIKRGQYFLATVVGNDITIVKHQKTVKQMPDGRVLPCKFVETLVEDCDELYNTLLEGLIPQNFVKKLTMKIIKGGKHPQTLAEEKSKQQADKNTNDPGLIAKAIEKLKKISK